MLVESLAVPSRQSCERHMSSEHGSNRTMDAFCRTARERELTDIPRLCAATRAAAVEWAAENPLKSRDHMLASEAAQGFIADQLDQSNRGLLQLENKR